MVTACDAATPATSPKGEPQVTPTTVVVDETIPETEATVVSGGYATPSGSSAGAVSDIDSSDGQQGSGVESDGVDISALDVADIAEQLGLDTDDLTALSGEDADDLAELLDLVDDDVETTSDDDAASTTADFFASFFDSFDNNAMEKSLEAALVPSECAAAEAVTYPNGYYTGSLIDTHFHMPPLDDDPDSSGSYGGAGGVDSGEYASIDPNDRPLLGTTTTLDKIACALVHLCRKAPLPVYKDTLDPLLDLTSNAVDRHGDLLVPFIQSTSSEISTVEAEVLEDLLGKKTGSVRRIR